MAISNILILVIGILSVCNSCIYAFIALKRATEPPKDEIWETATKILCNKQNSIMDADEFAELYEELKLFKDNDCSLDGIQPLSCTVREKRANKQSESDL